MFFSLVEIRCSGWVDSLTHIFSGSQVLLIWVVASSFANTNVLSFGTPALSCIWISSSSEAVYPNAAPFCLWFISWSACYSAPFPALTGSDRHLHCFAAFQSILLKRIISARTVSLSIFHAEGVGFFFQIFFCPSSEPLRNFCSLTMSSVRGITSTLPDAMCVCLAPGTCYWNVLVKLM